MQTRIDSPMTLARSTSNRLQPASAILLVIGLALAILTEGRVPELWTKAILAAMIAPTITTALWLTGPRPEAATDDRWARPAL